MTVSIALFTQDLRLHDNPVEPGPGGAAGAVARSGKVPRKSSSPTGPAAVSVPGTGAGRPPEAAGVSAS
ncbi:hypothetical protein [Kitasatospora sp. NPDC015120]|uniref:hypothetical protein n=1 Tax=Kitasatospora sp. NPDC015120 TaxID=3364023 RepID=UPI0036F47C77